MRPLGLTFIAASFGLLALLFWPLAGMHPAGAVFSQFIGCFALLAMAYVQLLATRSPGLELVFGSLDRLYILHKWLGIAALAAILLHENIGAEIKALGQGTAWNDFGEDLGELSLNGILVLILISIAAFIPYPIWRWSHKLMGAFFTLGAVHYILIQKPFQNFDLLGLYVSLFCLMGVAAYIWTLIPQTWFQMKRQYKISAIDKTGGAAALELSPVAGGIGHKAGQFAFISIGSPGLREVHPFTISDGPKSDQSLRFTIKPLGGYSGMLGRLATSGASVQVSRAFGHFFRPSSARPQIWIAGGVGITPFLAWLSTMKDSDAPIHLFACAKTAADIPHLAELRTADAKHGNLTLHIVESKGQPRLTAEQALAASGLSAKEIDVAFCGPAAMRDSLRKDFARLGLRRGRFHSEQFELRTGVGLGWLIAKLWAQIAKRR